MPANDQPPIIDAHVALGDEEHLHLDAAALLAEMDRHGIATAIARPMGGELAVLNSRGNDRVLSAGPRVRGLATVNPWFGAEGIDELRRAHERGAVGVYLHPTRQGFMPTDAIVEPVIDFAASANWAVVVHTGTYIQSDVLALAELARRRPETLFVADSCGFTDMWFELPGLMEKSSNIVLCGSMIWGTAIRNTVARFGASRVMFGSGAPRDHVAAALRKYHRIELNATDREMVMFDNANRIFAL